MERRAFITSVASLAAIATLPFSAALPAAVTSPPIRYYDVKDVVIKIDGVEIKGFIDGTEYTFTKSPDAP